MSEKMFGKVKMIECDNFDLAQSAAASEAMNTAGQFLPVVIFQQGNRLNLSGALYFGFVAKNLVTKSAGKKVSIQKATEAMNRPMIPEHATAIANYIKENRSKNYILPPLTLNIQDETNLYTAKTNAKLKTGFLVINPTSKLAMTDGQHRREAIEGIINEFPELNTDSIAVMITCETKTAQIHQDFADCSKTKALPPSQLAVYDLRNPANRLVVDVEEKCPLFRGKIDATSVTLSKNSTSLFLANQLRQFVKTWLVGSYQYADAAFEISARKLLPDDPTYAKTLSRFLEYVNYLTSVIPIWREIAKLEPGIASNQVKEWRQDPGFVCMSVTGLVVLGRIGYELFKETDVNWRQYADRLGKIDWKKTGRLWAGNLVRDNKIVNNQKLVRDAINAVRTEIDWTPKKAEELPFDEVAAEGELVAQ
jgi:DNA sulfur modification protein DndB